MTVNNQGHIFQSGDQTTTCIFTALLDLDGSRVRADPLFSMQITEYYIDCLICLKSIWSSHFRFGGVATQSLKSAHPSPWKHSVLPKGYLVRACTLKLSLSLSLCKSEISVCTLVWVICLRLSTHLQNILHGHLWVTERSHERESKRESECVRARICIQSVESMMCLALSLLCRSVQRALVSGGWSQEEAAEMDMDSRAPYCAEHTLTAPFWQHAHPSTNELVWEGSEVSVRTPRWAHRPFPRLEGQPGLFSLGYALCSADS